MIIGILTLKKAEDRGQKGVSTGFGAFAGMTGRSDITWLLKVFHNGCDESNRRVWPTDWA